MSLIEEALRKVQQPLPGENARRKQKPNVQQAPPPPEAPAEPPAAHSWAAAPPAPAAPARWRLPAAIAAPRRMMFVAAGVLVLAVLVISSGGVRLGRQTRDPRPAPRATAGNTSQTAPALSAVVQAGDTDLVLSGVVVGVGEPYAVINGEILAVGDTIAGATVQEITPGGVTLRLPDGRDAALHVPR